MFVLPYLLFSTWAGWLADRFGKRHVIIAALAGRMAVMALAVPAIAGGGAPWLLAILFLLGTQSAFVSPSRLGLIPEILPEEDLSRANGLMEMVTFTGIILGVIAGGGLLALFGAGSAWIGWALLAVSAAAMLAGLGIPRVPASGARRPFRLNVIAEVAGNFRVIARQRPLMLTVIGIAWFWFLGMVFQLNVFVYARDLMGLEEGGVTLLNACVSLGIGAGAFLAGRLSGDRVELGLVPIGSIGLGVFSVLLAMGHVWVPAAALLHALLGLSGGFFIVPLDAWLQANSAPGERGRVISSANFLAFTGVALGAGWFGLTSGLLGWGPATVMLVTGLLALAATAYVMKLLPDALVRLILWLLTHAIYRITVRGAGNIPKRGGALLVCNHISFVDAFLVGTCTQRFVRFLMYRPIYEARGIHWFAKLMGAIPVSERDGRKGVAESLDVARRRLLDGEVICIFAEGSISRTGNLLRFRKGFESIVKGTDVPIVPVHLDGVWGSIFSYQGGRFLWKWPRRIPYPVTVTIGRPLPASAEAWKVRQAVMELSADAFEVRRQRQLPLHVAFIRTARRYPLRLCVADSSGVELTFRRTLAGSMALAGRLRRRLRPDERNVGILLPSSVAGALTNAAVLMAGRVPVNLNFTGPASSLDAAVERCGIRTIITSEKLLDRMKIERREGMVPAESLLGGIGAASKTLHYMMALLVPARLLAAWHGGGATMDDLAAIIFTSGSTSAPKGVMLTHHNIMSNVEGMQQIFDIRKDDRMIGVLPFFHSFGFTATLWLPLIVGFGTVYHHNPLEARQVGELCRRYRVTFLVATPTFLQGYLARCTKEQLASLRYVVVGAERLRTELAAAFRETFGVEPLEGYGATELSPAATMSMPEVEEEGVRQPGHKEGSIGQPLPGVAARIVDPETFVDRPVGVEGLLLIRGANVMKGYLGEPERTAEAIRDGWYVTGDVARFDEDGFITLTDRLSRFAKVAGEMVPMGAVEEAIQKAVGAADACCLVVSLPDAARGEKLVVLHAGDLDPAGVVGKLAASGLPNLWIPRREAFHRVESLPTLGTGKVDLVRAREMAGRLEAGRPA